MDDKVLEDRDVHEVWSDTNGVIIPFYANNSVSGRFCQVMLRRGATQMLLHSTLQMYVKNVN